MTTKPKTPEEANQYTIVVWTGNGNIFEVKFDDYYSRPRKAHPLFHIKIIGHSHPDRNLEKIIHLKDNSILFSQDVLDCNACVREICDTGFDIAIDEESD